jgi:hypothetical protein
VKRGVLCLLLVFAACHKQPAVAVAEEPSVEDALSFDDALSPEDTLSADAVEAGEEVTSAAIQIPATHASLDRAFGVEIAGKGAKFVGAIHVSGSTATVEVAGETLPAVVYERQPFGQWTLFQTLAVAPNRLYVLWFYCSGGKLTDVYYEGTDGTKIALESAKGTCMDTLEPTTVDVELPAIAMDLPPLVAGFTLAGPQVALAGAAPGTVTLGMTEYTTLVFDEVDCTTGCGTPGWRELHTLLWDKAMQRLCFAIFYLLDPPQPLLLEYSLTLPDLTDPAGDVTLTGSSWTMP